MKRRLCYITCAFLALFATAQPVLAGSWTVYFGNLHSHSSVSDGKGTPTEAFTYARDIANVDFLCLTEHSHMISSQAALCSAADQAANVTSASTRPFLGFVGQEFSKLTAGNHINVFGYTYDDAETATSYPHLIPADMTGKYRELYQLLGDHTASGAGVIVCEFNHPSSYNKDYGIKSYLDTAGTTDWPSFVADADPVVRLIAIINGPAKQHDTNVEGIFRANYLSSWFFYLDRGLHLSPVADQDNHFANWGNATTARTGVLIDSQDALTLESMLQALEAGRCYATNDVALQVRFEANGNPMGSRLMLSVPCMVSFTLSVIDDDGNHAGPQFAVALYRDTIGNGKKIGATSNQTANPSRSDGLVATGAIGNGETWFQDLNVTEPGAQCYLVRVTQTGTNHAAWSAPIWLEVEPR